MKKIMIIALIGLFLPGSLLATESKLNNSQVENLKRECFLSDGTMFYQEWRDCQSSIVGTLNDLELLKTETLIVPNQPVIIGPQNETASLAEQVEQMQNIVKFLQEILAQLAN